jgi:hypothetical protein
MEKANQNLQRSSNHSGRKSRECDILGATAEEAIINKLSTC